MMLKEKSKVTGTRQTNPAVDLHDLPRIDLICLSHYHACVSPSLSIPHPLIHSRSSTSKDPSEAFTSVHDLDFFDEILVDIVKKGGASRFFAQYTHRLRRTSEKALVNSMQYLCLYIRDSYIENLKFRGASYQRRR